MSAGYDTTLPSMKPFMYVEAFEKCGDIAVIAFGAYNAMGLIGSEKGGVAIVLEHPHKAVLATKDIPWDSGERARTVEDLMLSKSSMIKLIEHAEVMCGFEWRVPPEDIKEALKGV